MAIASRIKVGPKSPSRAFSPKTARRFRGKRTVWLAITAAVFALTGYSATATIPGIFHFAPATQESFELVRRVCLPDLEFSSADQQEDLFTGVIVYRSASACIEQQSGDSKKSFCPTFVVNSNDGGSCKALIYTSGPGRQYRSGIVPHSAIAARVKHGESTSFTIESDLGHITIYFGPDFVEIRALD